MDQQKTALNIRAETMKTKLEFVLSNLRISCSKTSAKEQQYPKNQESKDNQAVNKSISIETELTIDQSIELADRLLPSVMAFIKKSLQSSLRFIAEDTESEIQEALTFYSKKFGLMQRKVNQLSSAIRLLLSRGQLKRAEVRNASTQSRALTPPILDTVCLQSLQIEGSPDYVATAHESSLREIEDFDNELMLDVKHNEIKDLEVSSNTFQLDLSEYPKANIDPVLAETVRSTIVEIVKSADKVYDLMDKFKALAFHSQASSQDNIKLEGRLNVVSFQSDKLSRQLAELLEGIAALAGITA